MQVKGKIIEVFDDGKKFYLLTEEQEKIKFKLRKYAPILSGNEFTTLEKLLGYKVRVEYKRMKFKFTKDNTELEGFYNLCNKVIYTP